MSSSAHRRSLSPHSHRAHHHHHREEEHARSRSPRRHPSHNHSPADSHRYRSRSPKPRSPPAAKAPQLEQTEERPQKKKKVAGGFKFKERKSRDGGNEEPTEGGKGLERGYRERDGDGERRPPAPPPSTTTQTDDRIGEKFGPGSGASVRDKFGDVSVAAKFGGGATTTTTTSTFDREDASKPEKKKKDKSKPPRPPPPTQELITVFVNDRLGTRAQIPCSPADTIGMFKKFVAQRIGRKPHEIMVKRQGERPFKDQLTLEDYGVGNGVQLDLELDTGD